MTYKPAEDSYLTLEMLNEVRGDVCIDVGTGSCILAKALVEKCRLIIAVDIEEEACRTCPNNIDVICSNATETLRGGDVVVSNLPYLPPEEPIDLTIHDLGIIPRVLRWISANRPHTVILTFSSLGRADFVFEALRSTCVILKIAKLHLFFESIFTVVAECQKPRR
ncbi:conserved hypothetical protein [Pyrobaculum islandicum DSM 4184]|uniref:Methylase n=1 Tax=Pyrobaculum islandicum (strain DSM 4184 / JCM 9189 / GEO3) TaxID=384616 RepID=A1RSV3_PYRIL|nr:class I SAM-dependent methyltransferase [Pyrobaculum islandicum]ABL88035.1 conserved hypothetical protein [Pyrobaculum islandicum DSM 4184]